MRRPRKVRRPPVPGSLDSKTIELTLNHWLLPRLETFADLCVPPRTVQDYAAMLIDVGMKELGPWQEDHWAHRRLK